MRPVQRQMRAEMPWTQKFEEALNSCVDPQRTLGRLLQFYRKDVDRHTLGGNCTSSANFEQGLFYDDRLQCPGYAGAAVPSTIANDN